MLSLTRRPGQGIDLTLFSAVDPTTPIGEVLKEPIRIVVTRVEGNQVRIALDGPPEIRILRDELSQPG